MATEFVFKGDLKVGDGGFWYEFGSGIPDALAAAEVVEARIVKRGGAVLVKSIPDSLHRIGEGLETDYEPTPPRPGESAVDCLIFFEDDPLDLDRSGPWRVEFHASVPGDDGWEVIGLVGHFQVAPTLVATT